MKPVLVSLFRKIGTFPQAIGSLQTEYEKFNWRKIV